ncbi:MAG: type I-C CRISPR-associated protein Cas8c/Csd1 [Lachnospiraceae bacterium]|nr:type I-C CRISPR-associated protein Cas8c/Csd1 [Lachnospiraceae bacterium]
MILGELADYYGQLLDEEKVGKEGWANEKVSYVITIDYSGMVKNIFSIEKEEERGKRKVLVPGKRMVPIHSGRSGKTPKPYYLCDNAKYLLGVWISSDNQTSDEKNKKQAWECFQASAEYHIKMLGNSENKMAQSICNFFRTWDFNKSKDTFQVDWKEIEKANLVFRSYETSEEILANEEVRNIWDSSYGDSEGTCIRRCLVSGKLAQVARLHPQFKGVQGANSSGATLVSFNGSAFESYGKEQGDNAPVCQEIANAYGQALNYLLSDDGHHRQIGDATTVFWAKTEKNESAYADFMSQLLDSEDEGAEAKLLLAMSRIAAGEQAGYMETELNPDVPFYILGLSPSVARISIRFFYSSTFGKMVANIQEHYTRMKIERPSFEKKEFPNIRELLYETVNKKSTKKQPQPVLSGSLMRAVLENRPYPAGVYNNMLLRIHSERKVNRNRAAFIKAYIIKNFTNKKEAADTMKLNEDTEYIPYVLGRLFETLEEIQYQAIEKETVKERYFNSASTTPSVVFPQMLRLANSHLNVLKRDKKGMQIKLEKQLSELCNKIHSDFPKYLSLEDQGIFMLGYYHQQQERFSKNENKNKDNKENIKEQED